ncbi:TLC ATP/ADP transporter [Geothermobacter ehrlichii]|uniref:ADP,ATP carrier protein n=1 Tax=Geothermobacter ehrlichii TaxID=213224 RepID=A0A5D3WK23_9BACT|nr:Npt1/Npt2 family nucleotide transporter [Geothermobacter ehrlichii]TYO98260.1 TLC ATP/ADP transporter [Geothermobacter ehrlichii]
MNGKMLGHRFVNWLGLDPGDLRVFLPATGALFFIGASNVLFGNFAETAFLKRFGVAYLPTMILVNAMLTVFLMALVGRWLGRLSGETVLRRVLAFCAMSAVLIWLAIPLQVSLLYPLVYLLKAQFELLLTFLFWNLANQIFSTRQSKRLFPLMVTGSLVGGISGGFATPVLVRLTSVDSLLWIYLGTIGLAFLLVGRAARLAAENPVETRVEKLLPKSSFLASMRRAMPVLRASSLVRGLVLLTLIPNMIVPMLNYQVSFAIDMSHANENAMVNFFGLYRGAQFSLALLVSLFAGRIYRKFGVTGGLMVHPFNYLLVFVAFMMQFDLLTAVYAGISTGVFRRALQTPARAALIGLFPNEQRVLLMPFLRGVVVRLGVLVGATFVLVCQSGYFVVCRFPLHPQNLAPFGFAFTLIWLLVVWGMKKHYPELVLETLGWRGSARGRLRLPDDLRTVLRNDITRGRVLLSRAAAVRERYSGAEAEELVACLTRKARQVGRDVLARLEKQDPSGRLAVICRAIEEGDARQHANAVEALEQLVPTSLAAGLARCLEGNLRGGRHLLGPVLEELAADRDDEIRALAARLRRRVEAEGP